MMETPATDYLITEDHRAIGIEYPVSIGTAKAMVGLLGGLSDQTSPEIQKYGRVALNLRTLVRNFGDSLQKEHSLRNDVSYASNVVWSEIVTLKRIIENVLGKSSVIIYCCDMSSRKLEREFPRARIKVPATPKQQIYAEYEHRVIENILHLDTESLIQVGDLWSVSANHKTVMLTHTPVDLLSRYNFDELTLLESHTGALKGHLQWSSKLTGASNRIPFDRAMIQLFGDGTTFLTGPLAIKKFILELAEKKRWTGMTTQDYVLSSVKDAGESETHIYLASLYRS